MDQNLINCPFSVCQISQEGQISKWQHQQTVHEELVLACFFLLVCRFYFCNSFFLSVCFCLFCGEGLSFLKHWQVYYENLFSRGESSLLLFKIIHAFNRLSMSESNEKKKTKPEAIFLTGGNTVCTCSVCHLRLHCLWCGMQEWFAEGQLTHVLWLPVASPAVILFINWEIWSSFKFIQNDLLWCCSCKTILLVLWSLFGNIFQLFGNCWLASYITICLTLTNNWRIPCWEIFSP